MLAAVAVDDAMFVWTRVSCGFLDEVGRVLHQALHHLPLTRSASRSDRGWWGSMRGEAGTPWVHGGYRSPIQHTTTRSSRFWSPRF